MIDTYFISLHNNQKNLNHNTLNPDTLFDRSVWTDWLLAVQTFDHTSRQQDAAHHFNVSHLSLFIFS